MHVVRDVAFRAMCSMLLLTVLFLLLDPLSGHLLESHLCLVKSCARQATVYAGFSHGHRVHIAAHDLTHAQIHPRIHIEPLLVQDDSTPFGLLKTGNVI